MKSLIATAAPLIGGLLGGPAGSGVGALIADKLGVEPTPESIEAALKSDPDALLKITQMESDERVALRKLKLKETALLLDYEQAKMADTQDARRQHRDHWMPWVLTLILALMVSGLFAALFFGQPPQAYAQVLIMIAGTVLGAFGTGVAFWLGSSQGSVVKNKQLSGSLNGK
ncbi:hypothetical protein SBX37_17880 [Vibrio mangrovi]|uniref:Uncharacterized protein n=1 Tax=Vibrio mangrovi TaxID=474394 RepID=A0ABU4I9T3_9VIBR|nr:hypothetical protein [Vibrio mangrovi]MDW6004730.1 hypothetical protein [Vibrio mangrovi]